MCKKSGVRFAIWFLLTVLLSNCGGSGSSENNDEVDVNVTGDIFFDLQGAKAVAASAESEHGNRSESQDAFGLVKIMEDGSLESIITLPDNTWMPQILFIAVAPTKNSDGTKDLFVSFDHDIVFWTEGYEDEETEEWIDGQEVNMGNFLHIKADGSFTTIMKGDGRICTWAWSGTDDYKPIVFDTQGNFYFNYETWGASNAQAIYKYSIADESVSALTTAIEGYQYQSFQIDPTGKRLFIKGERWNNGSVSSYFFRMYNLNDLSKPVNIYYSSTDDVWVRGYQLSPSGDSLVMNGGNVRGINGIIKVDILSDTELEYSTLYDSSSNHESWNFPEYQEWFSDWENKTYHTGLFDVAAFSNMRVLLTDGTKYLCFQLSQLLSQPDQDHFWNYELFNGERFIWIDTGVGFTLGTDLWFALDENDPSQKATETTWNTFKAAQTPLVVYSRWVDDGEELIRTPYNVSAKYYDDNPGYTNSIYFWSEYWYKNESFLSNEIDYDTLFTYISSLYIENIQFAYNGKIGEGALMDLYNESPYPHEVVKGDSGTDDYAFFSRFVKKESDQSQSAKSLEDFKAENNIGWLNFEDVGNLFYDSKGALWGILGGGNWGSRTDPKPIKLMDENGKRDLQVIEAFKDDTYKAVGFVIKDNLFYFRNAVTDAEGYEIGFHNLYRFDITKTDNLVVEDLLKNVPDNGMMEVVDFSIGIDYLYFTGVSGISLIGGKVDLETLEYIPFDTEKRLSCIEVYE